MGQFHQAGWTIHIACGDAPGAVYYTSQVITLPFEKKMTSPSNFRASRLLRRKMEQETKVKCGQMVMEAELKSQQCWDNCSIKVKELISSFEGLQQVIELYASFQPKKSKPTGNITGEIY